jgi:5,10-methylenetetrahydromethanopterin reductase
VAGAIAAATSRVRVGLGVVNPWTRHPMLVAMELAALDEIADGRAVLGLGASNRRWMTDQLGIPFGKPIGRLRESIEIVRAAFGGPVQHHGGHFQVDAELAFRPRRTRPPIYLGAKGRQALTLAATHADGLLLSILAAPAYVRWVRELAGPGVELSAYIGMSVDDDGERARDAIRPTVAKYLGVHGYHDITRVAGLSPGRCEALRQGWLAGDLRTDLVDDDVVDTFVVAGTPADAAARLADFAAAGLDVAVIRDDPAVAPRRILEQAKDLAAAAGVG